MKAAFLVVATLFLVTNTFSQQVTISAFTVKHELPGDISVWGADAANGVATGSVQGRPIENSKMVVKVFRNGNSLVCGNTPQSAQTVPGFTNKIIRTTDITAGLSDCILQPGEYTLCIEFFDIESISISKAQCRDFKVVNPITPREQGKYTAPILVSPVNRAIIKCEDLKKPLILRWTPVVPPPPPVNDVIYTVRVYEVYKDQEIAQAINANPPVFEKEVKTTQTIWLMPGDLIINGRTFAWSVQATNKEGMGYGDNSGRSEIWSFDVNCEKKIQEPPRDKPGTDVKEPVKNKEDSLSCKKFKVELKRLSNGDSISFKIKIVNNYKGSDLNYIPKSFKIKIKNDSVIAVIDSMPANWARTPSKFPPGSSAVIWSGSQGDIPNGETNLAIIHFGKPTANPVYIIYEWLNKDGKTICKDSIAFSQTQFYYSISSEYSGEVIEAKDTLFLQVENNYSSGSNKFTYTIKNLSNNKTSLLTKLDIKNNQGLIRIALPIQNSVVGKGETGILTLCDYKKYYYINFKRITDKVTNDREK